MPSRWLGMSFACSESPKEFSLDFFDNWFEVRVEVRVSKTILENSKQTTIKK